MRMGWTVGEEASRAGFSAVLLGLCVREGRDQTPLFSGDDGRRCAPQAAARALSKPQALSSGQVCMGGWVSVDNPAERDESVVVVVVVA
jgi:hypothetical protein